MRSVALAVLFTALLQLSVLAQNSKGNVSTKANLTVYVQLTNDRAMGANVHVRLYQRGHVLVGEAFTDERGRAGFGDVPAGFYFVAVEGTGIENTDGSEFEIMDMEGSHTETVRVKPVQDEKANGAGAGQPAPPGAQPLFPPLS